MKQNKNGPDQTFSLDKAQFNRLVKALENLVKVYAASQIKYDEKTEQNARFLKIFGFTEQETADLLGITQSGVHRALFKEKKKRNTTKVQDGTIKKA